jgi:hypothetical protein
VPQLAPQPISEIMDQLNQMKCVIQIWRWGLVIWRYRVMKWGTNLQTIEGNLMKLWRTMAIGRSTRKIKDYHTGHHPRCCGLDNSAVLGNYLTAGLSKNWVRQVVLICEWDPYCSVL